MANTFTRSRGTALKRSVACKIGEQDAVRQSDAFISENLSIPTNALRRTVVGRYRAGGFEANGKWTTRTYGYKVFYEHLINGVPVADDFVSVEVDDTGAGDCQARLHEKVAEVSGWERPLAPEDALKRSGAELGQHPGGVERSTIEYVRRMEGVAEEFTPAWRLQFQTDSGGQRSPDIWLHALTGEPLKILSPVKGGKKP